MALYAFDGTWNLRDGKEVVDHVQKAQYGRNRAAARSTVETNVCRMCEFYAPYRCEYLQGVGTRFGPLGRVLGGAFGLGGRHRIRRMYRRLAEHYFDGDRDIDLIGFSRGAALAVHFANLLDRHGLRNPSNRRHLAWWYYRELGWTFRHPKKGDQDVEHPAIRFLGLFDAVATFGWPLGPVRNVSRVWKVWEIPPSVNRAFHAMALDEIRRTFELVRPQVPAGDPRLYEVWFRGAHANVGGGYLDRGLSDIALAWMMEQAVWAWARQGGEVPPGFREALRLREPCPPEVPSTWLGTEREQLSTDPDGAIGRTRRIPRKPAWRRVPVDSLVHHTVMLRSKNLVSDHYNLNRSLLRPLPGDARPVFDPPLFYDHTKEQLAAGLAEELFARVPVRPADWLRLDQAHDSYIYRSDQWIAQGTLRGREADLAEGRCIGLYKDQFVWVATVWLMRMGDLEPVTDGLSSQLEIDSEMGFDSSRDAVRWIVDILEVMWPLVPRRSSLETLLGGLDQRHSLRSGR